MHVHVHVRVLGARVLYVACFCVGEECGACALVFAPAAACRLGQNQGNTVKACGHFTFLSGTLAL